MLRSETPIRFKRPRQLAWLASIASVVLAVWEGGPYDPSVAVLTATLVAVIWYTYWSYVAANREEPSYLLLGLEADATGYVLKPKVQNPTRRTIEVRAFLQAWVEQFIIDAGPFYAGEELIPVGPLDSWSGWLDLRGEVDRLPASGPNRTVHVRFHVTWTDDLGEHGKAGPKHWHLEVGASSPARVSAVLGESDIRRHFGPLAGFQLEAHPPRGVNGGDKRSWRWLARATALGRALVQRNRER